MDPQHNTTATSGTVHHLDYRNTMSAGWKTDEKVLQRIIKNNCIPKTRQDSVRLSIYYRSPTTANLS